MLMFVFLFMMVVVNMFVLVRVSCMVMAKLSACKSCDEDCKSDEHQDSLPAVMAFSVVFVRLVIAVCTFSLYSTVGVVVLVAAA